MKLKTKDELPKPQKATTNRTVVKLNLPHILAAVCMCNRKSPKTIGWMYNVV